MSPSNLELIRNFYAAAGKGDIPTVMGTMAADIEWREADNFIYADGNPYVGPNAILNGIFMRFATLWQGFAVTPAQFLDAGDTIIVTGRYTGTFHATGKALNAQFAHFWTLKDGQATHFQQYTDTLQASQVTSA